MQERQGHILKLLVEEYIKSAEPISSKLLCDKYRLECSSATVRNDMAALEDAGYIMQPHTSAGRVPTESAYRYYIEHFMRPKREQTLRVSITVKTVPRKPLPEERLHSIGLAVAEAAEEAVMLATTRSWSTTVGLAHLLRKPEFTNAAAVLALADGLEKFDAAFRNLLHTPSNDVTVLLGQENPFGNQLASLVVRTTLGEGVDGVIGIVGPLRMDYAKNIGLLTKAKEMLEQKALPV